jgi:hypothetical protein
LNSINANAVREHGEGAKKSNNINIVHYQHSPHKNSFGDRKFGHQLRSIDERYELYETLKKQLTASALTSADYEAAVQEAARLAKV